MMKRIFVLFTVSLVLFSCGFKSVSWDDLTDDTGSDKIPSVAPSSSGAENIDPWTTTDNDEEDTPEEDTQKPSGNTEDSTNTGNDNTDTEKGTKDNANDDNTGDDNKGDTDTDQEEIETQGTTKTTLKFSLSQKDANTKKTYIKSVGKIRDAAVSISSDVTKRAGELSSFSGICFYLKDGNSEFTGFLISMDGNVLIGKMVDGKWRDIKKIESCESVLQGLNQKNNLEVKIEDNNILFYINSNRIYTSLKNELTFNSSNMNYGILTVCSGTGAAENLIFDIKQM